MHSQTPKTCSGETSASTPDALGRHLGDLRSSIIYATSRTVISLQDSSTGHCDSRSIAKLDATTCADSDALFVEQDITPTIAITEDARRHLPYWPGCKMPIPMACYPGCRLKLMRWTKGSELAWHCVNLEQPQTMRKINIRKRPTAPFCMRIPGMSAHVKIRHGRIVTSEEQIGQIKHSSSMLNPAARPYVPIGHTIRRVPISLSQSAESLREWPRLHRAGRSGITSHSGSRGRNMLMHICPWTTGHYGSPTPFRSAPQVVPALDTQSIAALVKVTSVSGDQLSFNVDGGVQKEQLANSLATSVSSPLLIQASPMPASDTWEELCKDLLRVAAQFERTIMLEDTSTTEGDAMTLLDVCNDQRPSWSLTAVSSNWHIWGRSSTMVLSSSTMVLSSSATYTRIEPTSTVWPPSSTAQGNETLYLGGRAEIVLCDDKGTEHLLPTHISGLRCASAVCPQPD